MTSETPPQLPQFVFSPDAPAFSSQCASLQIGGPSDKPGEFTVRIFCDGRVILGKGYKPKDAAAAFWREVEKAGLLRRCERP